MAAYHLTAGEESAYRDLAEAEGMADNLQAVFERVNSRRRWAGDGPTATAPANLDAPVITGADIAFNSSEQDVYLAWSQQAGPPPPQLTRLYCWATPPMGAGRESYYKRLRFLGASATSPSSPIYVGSLYAARFGVWPAHGAMVGMLVQGYEATRGQAAGLYRLVEAVTTPIARPWEISLPWDDIIFWGAPGFQAGNAGWAGCQEVDFDPVGEYGQVDLYTNGSGEYVWEGADFPTTDVFAYRFKDAWGNWSNWSTVSITVTES
jgi:hypothetical protein